MEKLTEVNHCPVLAQRPAHAAGRGSLESVIVLCWKQGQDDEYEPFVTWEVTKEDDEPHAFLGHYFSSIKEAATDFEERRPPMIRRS